MLIFKASTQSQSHIQNHRLSINLNFKSIDIVLFLKATIHSHYKNLKFNLISRSSNSVKPEGIGCSVKIEYNY